jgi:hypothetical protein
MEPCDGVGFGDLFRKMSHRIHVDGAEESSPAVSAMTNRVFTCYFSDLTRRLLSASRTQGRVASPSALHPDDKALRLVNHDLEVLATGLASRLKILGSAPLQILAPQAGQSRSPSGGGSGGGGGGGGGGGSGGAGSGGAAQPGGPRDIIVGAKGTVDIARRAKAEWPACVLQTPTPKPNVTATFEEQPAHYVLILSAGNVYFHKDKFIKLVARFATTDKPFFKLNKGSYLVSPLLAPVDTTAEAVAFITVENTNPSARQRSFVVPHPKWFAWGLAKSAVDVSKSGAALPPYFQ